MDRSNIEKIAQSPEDRLLLAKLWDKIQAGIRRCIISNTCFLSLREQEMARYLFGAEPGLTFFGGYDEAERKMLVYLPEYLEEDSLYEADSPVVCLRATFFEEDLALEVWAASLTPAMFFSFLSSWVNSTLPIPAAAAAAAAAPTQNNGNAIFSTPFIILFRITQCVKTHI